VRGLRALVAFCAIAPVTLAAGASHAMTVSWLMPVKGNWNDGPKWSTGTPPQMGDDAVITVAGTYTVTLDTDPTVKSLMLGGASGVQTLQIGNRTLTLSGPTASVVNANGVLGAGNVTGASDLTVNGTLNWGNGMISGAGALTVNGTLIFDSGSSKILSGRTLLSNGTAQWKSSGTVSLANGAVLHNSATGTFDIQFNAFMGISGSPTTELFDNDGTLLKSAGGGLTTFDVPLDTSTGITVNSGTVVASRGGNWTGSLTTVAATVLRFNGGTHNLSGVTISGPGRTEIAGGTVNSAGAVTVAAMATLSNTATLGGAGPLTVNGTLEWNAGTITGSGLFIVNGVLALDSGSSKTLNGRALESNGMALWKSSGTLSLANGAVLHNAATGTFDIQFNAFMGISGSPTTELFDNDGTLMKSAGAGATTLDVPVDTSTGVTVSSGTLVATRGGTWTGALTTAAATVLRFNGGTHNLSGVTIGGTGRTEISGGTVNTAGAVTVAAMAMLSNTATLGGEGPLTVNGTLEWNAGTITGSGMFIVNGVLTLDSGSSKTLNSRSLESNGMAQWKSSGTLSLANGAVLHNSATGTFDMQFNAFMASAGRRPPSCSTTTAC
jgi:hypothetical protein